MKGMKPVLLSSKNLSRLMTENGRNSYAFVRARTAIDQMSSLFDSLDTLHRTPSPNMTMEGRALRYRQQFEKAMQASKQSALAAVEALNAHEAELVRDAEIAAGLHKHVDTATAQEIRSALRAMSQAERDRVVREAALAGDATIIQAIRSAASPLLTGPISVPMDEMIRVMIEQASPELGAQLEDISTAADLLEGAVAAFTREAQSRRDPMLEARAEQQSEATRRAEAALAEAAAGNPPAPVEPTT